MKRWVRVRRFGADQDGSVAVIAALSLFVVLGFCAGAVDLGSVFLQSRRLQGTADLAAMAAARDLDNAQAAATATAVANGWTGPLTVTVDKGNYLADSSIAAKSRFTAGGTDPDAVRVRLSAQTPLFFGQVLTGKSGLTINRQATAARADLASFSIGTRLASLNGGVVNSLLSGLTGSSINLSVMDYQALASANVSLFSYLDALATQANLTGLSYDKILQAKLTTGQALRALTQVLTSTGQTAAATAARALALAAGDTTPAHLDQLFDTGPYSDQNHVSGGTGAVVKLDAFSLTKAVLELSNGPRQVALDLGATVPGVAGVKAWLAIGQPAASSPWMTITSSKTVVVRTAQTRIYVEATVGGTGLLSVAQVKLPLYVEAASGEAKLNSLACSAGTAALDVRPGVGSLAIGEVDPNALSNFGTAIVPAVATIAKAPLFTITGKSSTSLGGVAWQTVSFSQSEVASGTVKTVSTTDLVTATVTTLLGNLSLTANILGVGIGLGQSALTQALAAILTPLGAPLDALLNSLTDLVGVHLGQADVRMNGLRCKDAALVA